MIEFVKFKVGDEVIWVNPAVMGVYPLETNVGTIVEVVPNKGYRILFGAGDYRGYFYDFEIRSLTKLEKALK